MDADPRPPAPDPMSRRTRAREARRTLWEDAKNLPNMLTFLRILMIPAVLVLLDRGAPRDCYWAAWVYALAAITDLLDGWLARYQGLVSVLGKFLDPSPTSSSSSRRWCGWCRWAASPPGPWCS